MSILFYNNPPAPAVNLAAAIPTAVAWPGAAVLPNLPAPALNPTPDNIQFALGDVAMRAALDIRPHFISPILTSSLQGLFRGALFLYPNGGLPTLSVKSSHKRMPSNWKRIFSETISAGIALTLAEHVADYPYFVPLEFCRPGHAPAGIAWPPAIAALMPSQYVVLDRWGGLMPDYVIARHNGVNWEFSTLESKGRDNPVHTANYAEYPKFKVQSMNAQLVPAAGFVGAPPLFTAHFLGVTALRSHLVSSPSRAVRTRWFNHRAPNVDTPVSDRWGIEFAAAHYSALLYRLGLEDLGNALGTALVLPPQLASVDPDVQALRDPDIPPQRFELASILEDTYVRRRSRGDFSSPILTDGTLKVLKALADTLIAQDDALDRETSRLLFEHNQRTRDLRNDQNVTHAIVTRTTQRGNLSLSSSGVGIVSDLFDEEDVH